MSRYCSFVRTDGRKKRCIDMWFHNPKIGQRQVILTEKDHHFFGYEYNEFKGFIGRRSIIVMYPKDYPVYLLTDVPKSEIADMLVIECISGIKFVRASLWKKVIEDADQT